SKVGEINKLKKELEAMNSNIEAIKKIRSQQQLPVRYIHEIAKRLPEESIWFESMNLNRNGLLEVSGVALDNQAFARYVDNLRDSQFIHSVNTERTSRRQVANRNLVEFLCQINAGPAESSSRESIDED
ncbi:MAG: PilN domain-containing protein, partial [Desulfovibrionales bacterium]|nr:PilN domain-containing protein [Desulfovibrionales bacterium]